MRPISARTPWFAIGFVLMLLAPGAALADAVYLKNGDRISGTVDHLDDEYLEITLPYADEVTLKIEIANVVSIETEGEVDVILKGGALTKARLERVPEGGVILHLQGKAPEKMPLTRLAYIKPAADESGVGVDWSGRVALGVTDTSGNTDTRDAYVEAELKATAKEWRWTTNGRAKYASNSGTQTAGSWLVGTRYDWLFRDEQYLYSRGSAQQDRFSGIDFRWTLGAGYGYKIFDTDDTHFELRAGLDYVDTANTVPPDKSYLAIGWGITFDHWLVEDKLQFFFGQEGFADPKGDDGMIIRSQTGFRAPIVDDLTANFQYNVDYNSDPGPGFKTTDRTYIISLGYSF